MIEQLKPLILPVVIALLILGAIIVFVPIEKLTNRTVTIPENFAYSLSGKIIDIKNEGQFVTIEAEGDQPMPMGSKLTFFITDKTILQEIVPIEKDKGGNTINVEFKEVKFSNLLINSSVVVQGKFVTNPEKNQKIEASAVSILHPKLTVSSGEVPPLESISIEKGDEVLNPEKATNALTGTVIAQTTTRVTIEASENQVVPSKTRREALITPDTKFQKMVFTNDKLLDTKTESISVNDVRVGSIVSVEGGLETNVVEQQSFEARSVLIIEGELK